MVTRTKYKIGVPPCNNHFKEFQIYFISLELPLALLFAKSNTLIRGARKLAGENLKPVWAEFSTIS